MIFCLSMMIVAFLYLSIQTAERRRRLQCPIRLARELFFTSSVTSRDTMLFKDV